MQVTLKAVALQRRSAPGSTTGASCTPSFQSDTGTPAAPASPGAAAGDAAGDAEGSATPRGAASVSGMSVRSGEWPTAASMMWDDLMVSFCVPCVAVLKTRSNSLQTIVGMCRLHHDDAASVHGYCAVMCAMPGMRHAVCDTCLHSVRSGQCIAHMTVLCIH
jgi:hypothetical protein